MSATCLTIQYAGGILDPKDSLSCLFRRSTPPECGSSRLLVEEGLIRSIAVDAVGHGHNVLYDQTLARNTGIRRLYNQTLMQLSHAAICGTSKCDPGGAASAILIAVVLRLFLCLSPVRQ